MQKMKLISLTKRLYRYVKAVVKYYHGFALSFFIRPERTKPNDKKVLVIIKPDGVGDLIIFLRFLAWLREKFPIEKWHVVLIANSMARPLVEDWSQHSAATQIDEYIGVDREKLRLSLSFRRQFIRKIKSVSADLMLIPVFSPDEWCLLTARLIKSPNKYIPRNDRANLITTFLLAKGLNVLNSEKKPNEFAGSQAFLEAFHQSCAMERGVSLPKASTLPLTLNMLEGAEKALSGSSGGEKYAILFISSSQIEKNWPAEKWSRLIKDLRALNQTVLVCGAPGDESVAALIAKDHPGLINLVGKTSLLTLTGLLAKAKWVVSVDTFFIHLAAAYKVPVLGIVGGMLPGRFWPYGDPSDNRIANYFLPCFGCLGYCIYPGGQAFPCIGKVEVDSVLGQIQGFLTAS